MENRYNNELYTLCDELDVFNFHGSMHRHIYFELIKTSLMQLFSVSLHFFFALHVSDVTHIHPQDHRYVHAGGTRK